MKQSFFPNGFVDIKYPKQGVFDASIVSITDMVLDCTLYFNENIISLLQQEKSLKEIMEDYPLHVYFEQYIQICKQNNIDVSIMFIPQIQIYNVSISEEERVYFIKKCVEFSVKLGCGSVIVPPLQEENNENILAKNYDFYLQLWKIVKNTECNILLMNQYRNFHGHIVRGACSEADEVLEVLQRLNQQVHQERFGFCMNIGICNLCAQNMNDFMKRLGRWIKVVIICDNNGSDDRTILPFINAKPYWEWISIIQGLRDIKYDGLLVLNIYDTIRGIPSELRPMMLQFSKAVLDYIEKHIKMEDILKKYKNRVLFGAGNMFYNYMASFGEEYPPLFTCDNNRQLWGSYVENIEIKSPECLKDLSEDCVIIVCNTYFRDIEQQIRKLGITNQIETFDVFFPVCVR